MKPSCLRWQSPCESSQMPVATRSNIDLTNFQRSGKMPATNLLRLDSVGEVSSESHTEPIACNRKLGFSKSVDSVSPTKNFSRGFHTNHGKFLQHSVSQMDGKAGFSSMNPYLYQQDFRAPSPSLFQATPNFWWTQRMPACLPRAPSHQLPSSHNSFQCQWTPFHNPSYYNTPTFRHQTAHNSMNCQPPRLSGLMPGVLFSAMPKGSDNYNPKAMPSSQGFGAGCASERVISQNSRTHSMESKLVADVDLNSMKGRGNFTCTNSTCCDRDNLEFSKDQNSEVSTQSIESCVDKLNLNDTVHIDKDKQNDDQKLLDEETSRVNNNVKDNCLKRRNEKSFETSSTSKSNPKCPLANAIDFSNVLFLRKTPKKGRPSCKKRRKRHHATAAVPHSNESHNMMETHNVSEKKCVQSKCESPAYFSTSATQPSHKAHHTSTPSKSRPSFVATLFCSPTSDSELSDNDMDDCDSVKLPCDLPKSLSPLHDLGSSLSFDALFKPKNLSSLDTLLNHDKCDLDQEKSQSPTAVSSPGSKSSLRFSLSFSVSDDEDSDRSHESFSSSPSEHFIVDFYEFGNGLSLEAILGNKRKGASEQQCTDNVALPSVQDPLLVKINAEWNKNYPSLPSSEPSFTDTAKVQFAIGEDLVHTHIVGNEERRGTWREDGERFQKRIEDIGKVISYVFTDDHRQRVTNRMKCNK